MDDGDASGSGDAKRKAESQDVDISEVANLTDEWVQEVIDEMVAHCRKGPFFARVKSLERISAVPAGRAGFTIGATV